MTDQISSMLHAEADHLDVPRAPAADIVAQGRRLRRRRRVTGFVAVTVSVAAAAAVAGTVLALPHSSPDGSTELAVAATPDPDGWAVAQGTTVHLGSGRTVEVPGKVKAMYYTSAGVMVRTGRTAYTDGDGVSNYFVLDGNGQVRDFALDLGDKKPGTDPTLPYLAYVVKGTDARHWELVLRDVRTGEVATRVAFEGAFTWGGWNAPPTALSGDHAYVGMDRATLAIDWRTGEVREAKGLAPSRMPTVAGGRELLEPGEEPGMSRLDPEETKTTNYGVLDAETGDPIRTVTVTGSAMTMPWPQLAPDGRHVLLSPWRTCDESGRCTYDEPSADVAAVDHAGSRSFPIAGGTFGWSPDGRLLLVTAHKVESCDADTGECTATPVELTGTGPLRVSGNDNES